MHKAAPGLGGNPEKSWDKACTPPAEAPIAMILRWFTRTVFLVQSPGAVMAPRRRQTKGDSRR